MFFSVCAWLLDYPKSTTECPECAFVLGGASHLHHAARTALLSFFSEQHEGFGSTWCIKDTVLKTLRGSTLLMTTDEAYVVDKV